MADQPAGLMMSPVAAIKYSAPHATATALDLESGPAVKPPKESRPGGEDLDSDNIVVLSFRALQLRRLASLQDKLLTISASIANKESLSEAEEKAVDAALADYAQALRNYETLSQNAVAAIAPSARFIGFLSPANEVLKLSASRYRFGGWRKLNELSPFLDMIPDTTSRPLVKAVSLALKSAGDGDDAAVVQGIITAAVGPVGFREVDAAGRIRRAQQRAFTARLVFALLGGAALIGPVLIMTLHASRNTSLVTVSVATFLFAAVMALFATGVDGKDVLAATAAYVAVLVVFVGTSLPTSS